MRTGNKFIQPNKKTNSTFKTILVTGGAGFIGSSLIEKLLPTYRIICIDDFNNYYFPLWKETNVQPFHKNPNFTLNRVDILNHQELIEIFRHQPIDAIVHLAARAGVRPSIQNPQLYEEVNIRGTLNLLELAKEYQVPHFILASSSSVYGNQSKVPFCETDPINQPISPYAATKKSAEMLCYTYAYLYNIKTTCLRFFTVYGPKGRPDMAPYLFTEALLSGQTITQFGDGTTERDYTYIDDIVAGIIKAIQRPFAYEIINLGNNQPVSLNEFIQTLETVTDKKAKLKKLPMQAGDVEKTYADISKAKQLLDWAPKTSLEEGLKRFVKWYKTTRMKG